MRTTLLFTTSLALSLAASACSTHSVRRSALVPHMAPTMRDGQGLGDAVGQLDLGSSAIVAMGEPKEGDTAAGLHIPNTQVNGALRLQPTRNFDIGVIYERGFDQGSTSIAPDQPDPEGDAQGLGISLGYSVQTRDPGFRVGLTMEFINYTVPYVEYRTCIDNCYGSPYTEVDRANVNVPVIAFGVTPSMRRGPWTFFGGLTLRSHPTVERGGVEYGEGNDEDLESGPLNAVVAAGTTFTTPARVSASVLIYQTISQDPVEYAPTLAATLSLPFGTKQF